MIRVVHQRRLPASIQAVGALIDGLAGRPDPLWPAERWPPMAFDRPLGEGAAGGHGPVRYYVEEYEPGKRVRLRFTRPPGLVGFHEFSVEPSGESAVLRHLLEAEPRRTARLTWPLVFRPLHDALLEDALDKAENAVTGAVERPRDWSLWVRVLRRLLQPLARRRPTARRRG